MSEQYPTMGHEEGFGHTQHVPGPEQGYGDPTMPHPQYAQPPQVPVDGLGLTGMVLGLSLLIFGWFPFVGIILAGLAIVFSALGLRRVRRGTRRVMGFAVTGLVMGIVGVLGCTLWTIATMQAANDINKWDQCTDTHPVGQWDRCDKYLD